MKKDKDIKVLFEDEKVIAVHKVANQFVHPMSGDRDSKKNNLLFLVRDHLNKYVYPINRLDRPVSGIVLFAKEQTQVKNYQEIWHSESTKKQYQALCMGEITQAGVFDSPLSKQDPFSNGQTEKTYQEAKTSYDPVEYFCEMNVTYLNIQIYTGRYHQIRRHFRKAVKPLVGDRKHGKGKVNNCFRDDFQLHQIFLHCHKLEYIDPFNKKKIIIDDQLPENLKLVLKKLKETRAPR